MNRTVNIIKRADFKPDAKSRLRQAASAAVSALRYNPVATLSAALGIAAFVMGRLTAG